MSGDTERELESKVRAAIGAVSDWVRTAEIKLNSDKTEIISIERTKINELKVGENEIKTKRCLKYFGVMIDDRLMWKDQLDHITNNTEKLLLRVIPACWSRGILKLRDKLRLYRQVFLPMILYGHEVWFDEIKHKSTYVERITRLQRRVLRTVTGAYRCASSSKLLELTNQLPIEVELRIRSETNNLGENSENEPEN